MMVRTWVRLFRGLAGDGGEAAARLASLVSQEAVDGRLADAGGGPAGGGAAVAADRDAKLLTPQETHPRANVATPRGEEMMTAS